jgi:hypothetical protein
LYGVYKFKRMVETATSAGAAVIKNEKINKSWADESGDSDNEENNNEIGQDIKADAPAEEKEVVVPKKDYGAPIARDRNMNGDFIVTTINVPDIVVPVLEDDKNSGSEESSEESAEEEPEVASVEKKGKRPIFTNDLRCVAPVKILSKKEQKKLEDEEFERALAEMGVETKAAPEVKPEAELKEAVKAPVSGEKSAAQKKKEKKNAKKAEEEKKEEPAAATTEPVVLTEEQRKAALKEALEKRQAKSTGGKRSGPDVSAAVQEAKARKNQKKSGPKVLRDL